MKINTRGLKEKLSSLKMKLALEEYVKEYINLKI